MEHQTVHFGRDPLDQNLLQSKVSQVKQHKEEESKSKGSNNNQISKEEAKIRTELEMDIEKDLEEELKAQLCRLAFRLHRLYQHQKDNNNHISHTNNNHVNPEKKLIKQHMTKKNNGANKSKVLSEINISIKTDGGTKVEIREMKKPQNHRVVPLHVHKQINKVSISKYGITNKKFEWTKSLRSGPPKSSIQVLRNKMEGGKQDARFRGRSRDNKGCP